MCIPLSCLFLLKINMHCSYSSLDQFVIRRHCFIYRLLIPTYIGLRTFFLFLIVLTDFIDWYLPSKLILAGTLYAFSFSIGMQLCNYSYHHDCEKTLCPWYSCLNHIYVTVRCYYSTNFNTVQIWSWFSQYLSSVGNRYPAIYYVILYAATSYR